MKSHIRRSAKSVREPVGSAGLLIAVTALIFAMAGGAWAAKKYVITSTSQIKPAVLKKLEGKAGAVGAQGLQGAPGANGKDGTSGATGKDGAQGAPGATGPPGPEGPLVEALPSGKSLTGAWSFTGTESVIGISYQFKLAAPIAAADIIFLKSGEGETADCPGTEANPKAAQSKLCVYSALSAVESEALPFAGLPHSTLAGVAIFAKSNGIGYGTWAVKAP